MTGSARPHQEPLQSSLAAITARMRSTILRALASRALIDRRHVSCALATADARIVQIDTPARLGISSAVLHSVLAAFNGKLSEGDIVVTNDPFSGGTHLQDVAWVRPICAGGILLGYSIAQVPLADIGGNALGGYDPRALEIWAEGVRVTPVKCYRGGSLQRDAVMMLLLNSRLPQLIEKDLEIIIGALIQSERDVTTLADRYTATGYTHAVHELLTATEAHTRKALQGLPDGTWHGESAPIHSCLEEREFRVVARMTVTNGAVTLDFSGSAATAKGFINTTASATTAAALVPFHGLWPTLSVNSGVFPPFSFVIPERTLVNATVPVSVGWSSYHPSLAIAQAVTHCLAQAQRTPIAMQHIMALFSPPTLPFAVTGCGRLGCPFPSLPQQ